MRTFIQRAFLICSLVFLSTQAGAWHDRTHITIAKAAGYEYWFNAAGPDIAKIKAGHQESYNHWFNNNRGIEVTPWMVMNQISRYNKKGFADAEGHLYGAIIAACREYELTLKTGNYGEYHIAYAAHYIGDLSNPLHNTPYDDFNKIHHSANDGTVEKIIMDHPERIKGRMYAITLRDDRFEADLSKEIARIANQSRKLGYTLRKQHRDMTPDEAYTQLGHSASLLKAVLKHFKKI
jgi:hypothetical protein